MKLIHLSDLHLGKRVNEFSMLEDQEYILAQILRSIDQVQPQAVLIAGDIYDKALPSAEAVELFDDFLVQLSRRGLRVFVISGNHDSPERIAFGGRLMDKSGIYLSPVYDGQVKPVTLEDNLGPVNFYMLPFVKPANVRRFFPEEEITSYTEALRTAIQAMDLDPSQRNVLLAHQFVTGALRSESEEISVGGSENVDAAVFGAFDYVALGHIHRAQACGSDFIRYSGTPLKYSFSEAKDKKSLTVVELEEKGRLGLSFVPLQPKRDLVELRGRYDQLTLKSFYANTSYPEDYVHITLTDEEDIPDALAKLRVIYKNIMKLDYDNLRTRHLAIISGAGEIVQKSPLEHFSDFYQQQNGQTLSQDQQDFVAALMEEIWRTEQ